MPDPNAGDMFEDLSKISKGLAALKEVWSFSSRMAAFQEKYRFKAAPIGELFGAMLGFGEKQNPLEFVEKQLVEINAKLDRVLAGIEEIKVGQLGQSVLAAYIDISDPVSLVNKYFEDFLSYVDGSETLTDARRKDFIDKLLGTKSERDSVFFNENKILKLGPNQASLLFELLFPYLTTAATGNNAREVYLKGAYAFRFVAEMLNKGLILETFALASSDDEPAKSVVKVEKMINRYKGWMKAIVENSFLPFAEKLATLNFQQEYLGGHDTRLNANFPLEGWEAATPSILQSADELGNRLLGKSKSVTLRVIPNVPPIADKVPSKTAWNVVSAGTYAWEATRKPQTTLTRDNLFDKLEPAAGKFFFYIHAHGTAGAYPAESVRKVEGAMADGANVPPGFDKSRFRFLRYQFDVGALPDGTGFHFGIANRDAAASFPFLDTTWTRIYTEEGHRFKEDEKSFKQGVIDVDSVPGEFKLPQAGQLSPVLVTYAYQRFGGARK